MTPEEFRAALGREPGATDQPPGTYRYRANRKAPFQAVRIFHDNVDWFCIVNGEIVGHAPDPERIKFILWHGPFHPITEAEYLRILDDYQQAKDGSPLKNPEQPVNVRKANPL